MCVYVCVCVCVYSIQFTCFTSTTVQILTSEELRGSLGDGGAECVTAVGRGIRIACTD
jgi:hypothetical protein